MLLRVKNQISPMAIPIKRPVDVAWRRPPSASGIHDRNQKQDSIVDQIRAEYTQKDPGSDAEAFAPEQAPEETDELLEHQDEVLR